MKKKEKRISQESKEKKSLGALCKGCPFSYPNGPFCFECQGGKNRWVLDQVIQNMTENGIPLYIAAM